MNLSDSLSDKAEARARPDAGQEASGQAGARKLRVFGIARPIVDCEI